MEIDGNGLKIWDIVGKCQKSGDKNVGYVVVKGTSLTGKDL